MNQQFNSSKLCSIILESMTKCVRQYEEIYIESIIDRVEEIDTIHEKVIKPYSTFIDEYIMKDILINNLREGMEIFAESLHYIITNYEVNREIYHKIREEAIKEEIIAIEPPENEDICNEQDNIITQNEEKILMPEEVLAELKKEILIRNPVLSYLIFIILYFSGIASGIEWWTNILTNVYQGMYVYITENENIFFIKAEETSIYEEPFIEAKVIGIGYYSECVEVLEDSKMWVRVLYQDVDGNNVLGWIKKTDLFSYEDWKFNSQKLYKSWE